MVGHADESGNRWSGSPRTSGLLRNCLGFKVHVTRSRVGFEIASKPTKESFSVKDTRRYRGKISSLSGLQNLSFSPIKYVPRYINFRHQFWWRCKVVVARHVDESENALKRWSGSLRESDLFPNCSGFKIHVAGSRIGFEFASKPTKESFSVKGTRRCCGKIPSLFGLHNLSFPPQSTYQHTSISDASRDVTHGLFSVKITQICCGKIPSLSSLHKFQKVRQFQAPVEMWPKSYLLLKLSKFADKTPTSLACTRCPFLQTRMHKISSNSCVTRDVAPTNTSSASLQTKQIKVTATPWLHTSELNNWLQHCIVFHEIICRKYSIAYSLYIHFPLPCFYTASSLNFYLNYTYGYLDVWSKHHLLDESPEIL